MTLQERLEQESKETSVIQVPLGNVNDNSILEQYPGERVTLADLQNSIDLTPN